ncbi:MAG: hypothetical protein WCV69_03995 [Patescibacteria group bacterium]|jgi:hypothetical protein
MTTKKQLSTITILIKDRQMHAKDVNQLLTDAGHMIMARLGVNVQPACIAHCTGLIVVVAKGTTRELKSLTLKLNKLYGIVAKINIVSD